MLFNYDVGKMQQISQGRRWCYYRNKSRFLHERELQARRKKERNVQFTKKKKRNVDGHASDPHISSRETEASLVQRSIRPHSSTKLLLESKRELGVSVAIPASFYGNVGPLWHPEDQPHSPKERRCSFSRAPVLKYIDDGVTWYMLLSSALVSSDESQLLVITP